VRNAVEIEDIEQRRLRAGINAVELWSEIRRLPVGDFVHRRGGHPLGQRRRLLIRQDGPAVPGRAGHLLRPRDRAS
jgi:hypothetical protein